MPRPRGWTADDEARRDRCVEDLLREGVPPAQTEEQRERTRQQRAFAICTAAVQRSKGEGA